MRINGSYGRDLPSIPSQGRPGTSRSVGGANSEAKSAAKAELLSSQAENLERLRQFPEVRPERLQEIRERLASGEYFTREVAEKTAQALIDLNDR